MEFHRTFLALPLEVPESFRAARTSLRESLAGEKIRWVEPGLMHLTLRFLGDVRNEDLEKIGAGIRGGLDRPGNLVCSLGDLGTFGGKTHPRVIVVPVQPPPELLSLKAGLDDFLSGFGFAPPEFMYRPHVTLGRLNRLKDPERFGQVLDAYRQAFQGAVEFDRLVLYKSILGSSGPRYVPLEILPFSPSGSRSSRRPS